MARFPEFLVTSAGDGKNRLTHYNNIISNNNIVSQNHINYLPQIREYPELWVLEKTKRRGTTQNT